MTDDTNIPRQPRPTPRIALLTCRHHDHIDHAAEGRLMQELVRQGAVVKLLAWDDIVRIVGGTEQIGEGDLADIEDVVADLMVLRTTWDYWDRLEEFRQFLKANIPWSRLENTATTALANLDKTYLRELEAAGVPIVPTIFVTKGSEPDAIAQAKSDNWSPLIIKPTIAAAAVGLKKFDRPDNTAADYLIELTNTGGAMVQPYLPRITTEGETSLVYFDNAFSHAVTKIPAPGDFRSQVDFGGAYTLVEPTEAQLHVAELALTAWEARYGDKPLYARVDLVPGHDGQPLLGELELIEPELFLDMDGHAAEMFAAAILARVIEPSYTPAPWWKNLLVGTGCFLVFVALAVIFAAGVGAIIGLIFGGP